MKAIGDKAVQAIKDTHGKTYICGSSIESIYPSSGGSNDWIYEKGFADISYIIELRGPLDSTNMFILPAEEIILVGEEILEAFIALLKEGKDRGYYNWKNPFLVIFLYEFWKNILENK